jgi:hypothetical protein
MGEPEHHDDKIITRSRPDVKDAEFVRTRAQSPAPAHEENAAVQVRGEATVSCNCTFCTRR